MKSFLHFFRLNADADTNADANMPMARFSNGP